jgi:hypothetical protein
LSGTLYPLLEEEWLHLDDLVAPRTKGRKRAIAPSIALIEYTKRNNTTAYDGRNVFAVFLRHETYESFLTFPQADIWGRLEDVLSHGGDLMRVGRKYR